MGTISVAGLSDQGCVRKHNEDHWFADPDQGLFIVSDGMGGHLAGELASRIVVDILPLLLKQGTKDVQNLNEPEAVRRVLKALSDLSDHLRHESSKYVGFSGMGATVVFCLIRDTHALIAHMGDSRTYLLRKKHLEQLTTDHSIVQLLIDTGELTSEEAAIHPARSRVTRYIGMRGEPLPEVRVLEIIPGDRILLCTDGLTKMLVDSTIAGLLMANPDPEDACRALVDTANAAGGKDNITVVVVDCP